MSQRILVVEDQEDNRKILRDLLTSADFEVIEAVDGEAGLAAAEAHRPDLILMDIQLPILDGYEATRRLKADAVLHTIPVIAVTAHALSGDDNKARAAGCDAYIAKPISPRQLLAKVREYLAQATPTRRREFIAGVLLVATIGRTQAQQPAKVHRIAVLSPGVPIADMSETGGLRSYPTFFKELRRLGYVEGQNLVVERYSGEGWTEHYAELAGEVVRLKTDLIFASSNIMMRHFTVLGRSVINSAPGDPLSPGRDSTQPSCGAKVASFCLAASPQDCQAKVQPTPMKATIRNRVRVREDRLSGDCVSPRNRSSLRSAGRNLAWRDGSSAQTASEPVISARRSDALSVSSPTSLERASSSAFTSALP